MNTPSFLKKSFYSALVFFGTLIVLSVGYAAWNATMSSVTAGNPLTANGWNSLVDNIADLNNRWGRSGSDLVFTGGDVGIGTTNPNEKLEVNGKVLIMDGGNYTVPALKIGTTNNGISYPDINILSFITASTARMTINASGSVGIGTTNPGALLDIRGALSAGDSKFYNSIQLIDSFNGTTQSWIWAGGSNQLNLGVGGIAAGNTKMVIDSNGNVGIGAATVTSGFKLEVAGRIKSSGADDTSSDIRFKKNIQPLENALDKITSLNGVSFDWRIDEFSDKNFKKTKDIGVIAQNVEKVFPELVTTGDDGYKSVAYASLVAPLIEAIKELSHKIDTLFIKYFDQQKEIDSLKTRLDTLEQR